MECDSIHSSIESEKKKTAVYVPSQWHTVVSLARRRKPYVVIPLRHDDVKDYKKFVKQCCPNLKVATNGDRINWRKIKWIQVRKGSPRSIYIKYSFKEEQYLEIAVQKKTRAKGRPAWMDTIPPCYNAKLPISELKKKDLLGLCKKGVIPEEHHPYYNSLPTASTARDLIPGVTSGEESDAN
jgi:hypothetical protein